MISLNPYVSIEEKEAGRRIRAHMVLGNQLSSVICTGFLPLDAVYTFSNVSDCLTEVRFAMWLNMDSCTFSSSTYGTKLISKSLKGTPLSCNATHKPDLHFPLYQTFANMDSGSGKYQIAVEELAWPLPACRRCTVVHMLIKLQVELEAVKKTEKNYRACSVKINLNYQRCLLKFSFHQIITKNILVFLLKIGYNSR